MARAAIAEQSVRRKVCYPATMIACVVAQAALQTECAMAEAALQTSSSTPRGPSEARGRQLHSSANPAGYVVALGRVSSMISMRLLASG